MIETENYIIKENKLIFKHEFNIDLTEYYDLISNYKEIIFGEKFNQSIELNNLTHLVFGY